MSEALGAAVGGPDASFLIRSGRRPEGSHHIGRAAGLDIARSAIIAADKRILDEDRARRRAGEVVQTRNQGDINTSINTAGEADRLIESLNAGGLTSRNKLNLEEQQEVIARKQKERAERESIERGATLSSRSAGVLQSLFTRDTDIPEDVFSTATLGKKILLGS